MAIFILLPARKVTSNPLYDGKTMAQKLLSMDIIGGILSLAAITSLLLPLQWGGNTREWNDPVVIGLLATVSRTHDVLVPISEYPPIVWCPSHHIHLVGMVYGVGFLVFQ